MKKEYIISFSMHILVILTLLIFGKPISVLVPSRSDGMEVSLVSMPNQSVKAYVPPVKVITPSPVQTLDTPADVNLKDKAKPKPATTPAEPQKAITKLIKPASVDQDNNTPQMKTKTKPLNKKAQINDLLGDVLSSNTSAIRKGKALGGNPNGTSDSNNLIGNYADSVINAVRPFVLVPEDINPKAKAIVKVELNPNLSVRSVTMVKSSGNPAYDQNVQDAIKRLKVFPPLPDNAKFVDYRILKLIFRPE